MRLRHLHQRTRPFRYGGFWVLALSLATTIMEPDVARSRTVAQLTMGVLFCGIWPWVADRLRALRPADEVFRLELAGYAAECALVALVLAWASVPPLTGFSAAVCLLAGATALAGWRLLVPALAAALAGGALGAIGSPVFTTATTPAADAVCLVLLFGYTLSLAQISFRQAQRLDRHRQTLAERSATLERINGRMQRYLPPSLRAARAAFAGRALPLGTALADRRVRRPGGLHRAVGTARGGAARRHAGRISRGTDSGGRAARR